MNYFSHPIIRALSTLWIVLLLSGCATKQETHIAPTQQFAATPDHYLDLSQQSLGDQADAYTLQAINAYLQQHNYPAADNLLSHLAGRQLSAQNQAQFLLLAGQLNLFYSRPGKAMQQLSSIDNLQQLPIHLQIQQHELLAQSYQLLGEPLNSVQERLLLAPLLSDSHAIAKNNKAIWRLTKPLSDTQLDTLRQNPRQPVLQAWATLMLLARQNIGNGEQWLGQLQQWQQRFPEQPANHLLTPTLPPAASLLNTPKQIALMLPLQGKFASQAQAILQGFMQAWYQQAPLLRPQLQLIDTSHQPMANAYQQAIAQPIDMIIGPLTKDHVQALAALSPSVPVLALNYTDVQTPENFYQFGLSPDNESLQIADYLWEHGKSQVASISMAGSWSDDVMDDFTQRFSQLGGQIVGKLLVKSSDDVRTAISRLLNVQQSQTRANQLQRTLGETIKSTPRRRQDIDAILLNASPTAARQILPLLRFYYASSIPVYASSIIYDGMPNSRRDGDLNGVSFLGMPWTVAATADMLAMRKQLRQLWPSSFNHYSKLYAIGFDAYQLPVQLNRLRLFPQSIYHGTTGSLFLTADGHVYRDLHWAKFRRGIPKRLD